MPASDQLEVISATGEVTFHDLQPGRTNHIGQDSGGQVQINKADIRVQATLDLGQRPYQITLIDEQTQADLNGELIPPNVPTPITHGGIIRIDSVVLILLESSSPAAPSSYATNVLAVPTSHQVAALATAHDFSTVISQAQWTMKVEQTAVYRLTLANNGSHPATFFTAVEGVDEHWLSISTSQIELNSGEQKEIIIAITPPRQPSSRAGRHELTIRVTSPDYLGQTGRHTVTFVIEPYYEVALAEMSPKRQSLSKRTRFGRAIIPIVNKSNAEAVVRLVGADEAGACHIEFQPPGEAARLTGQVDLTLSPGERLDLPVRIIPPPHTFIGMSKSIYPFTITTLMLRGSRSTRFVLGWLESPPLIGPWLTSFFAICLTVLLVFVIQTIADRYRTAHPLRRDPEPNVVEPGHPNLAPAILNRLATEPVAEQADPTIEMEMTYEQIFQEIAPQFGLDWRLMAELAYQESRMDRWAIGRDSDLGLMQIIPSTWDEWAPKMGVTDPFDPYSNILVAAAYLAYVRDYSRANGYLEEHWALVGYNWGPDHLRQIFEENGNFADVPEKQRHYVLAILQARAGGVERWKERSP
jgi:hypothetical protein